MRTGSPGGQGVAESQQQWRDVRAVLKQRRHEFIELACDLYAGVPRVEKTALLSRPAWVPDTPVELERMRLGWVDPPPDPAITAAGPESAAVRPLAEGGRRFETYADAVDVLDRPALFENRPIYRLLAASLSGEGGGGRLELTSGRYFTAISVAEALGHEFAAARIGDLSGSRPADPRHLPLRTAIGDPCDLSRRPASVAVTTLTLRRTRPGEATFLLHWRDPARVSHAGGLYQVIPVGIFQPADDNPASVRHDLDIFCGLAREYSEELLGASEDYSHLGSPIPYQRWPFYQRLTAARQAGGLRIWIVGVGVDPLTLVTDILAVAVFDAGLFDDVFDGLVTSNSEGRVVSGDAAGFGFTGAVVDRLSSGEPMQASGAAILRLAWKHRDLLLA